MISFATSISLCCAVAQKQHPKRKVGKDIFPFSSRTIFELEKFLCNGNLVVVESQVLITFRDAGHIFTDIKWLQNPQSTLRVYCFLSFTTITMSQPRMPGSPDSFSNLIPPDVTQFTPVPPYVFFLIIFGIGLLTLLVLYVCVRFVRHRRRNMQTQGDIDEQLTEEARAREAADMARVLRERISWQVSSVDGNHGTNGGLTTTVGPNGTENTQEANLQARELTYVVMAGDVRPRFLAYPALAISQAPPSPRAVELSVKEPKE